MPNTVPYAVGDCFVRLTGDEVEARLEKLQEEKKKELEEVAQTLQKLVAEMEVLKESLYATFGNALYLEEE